MRFASGWTIIALSIAAVAMGAKDEVPAPLAQKTSGTGQGVGTGSSSSSSSSSSKDEKSKEEKKTASGVEQLIKDLGSEDYRTREKAGRELTARGEKILPNLRAALAATEDPEVQRRLLVMVRKLDYERLVAPKRVKLSLKNKTVKEALAEIGHQTGYKIEYGGDGSADSKQDFEFDNVTFWQAVDKVAAVAGCVVGNDNGDEVIRIYNQEAISPYVSYAGPFRFVASNINSNTNVQLAGINRRGGGPNRQEFMNLTFEIHSEPKNPMLGITQVDLISAADEFGGTLIPPKDPNNRANYFNNNGAFRGNTTFGSVNLSRANKTSTTIKTLKAKVGIILLSGTVPEITIPDPLKVKNKTFSGRTVEVELGSFSEVANNKGHYQLEVTAKKLGEVDPDRNEDFNWSNTFWQKIEVLDSAGNRYQTFGPNSIDNDGATVTFTLPFGPEDRRTGQASKLGAPVKLVINEWKTAVNEATFEFKDIPLP
jgi:hypothetical protein